MPNQTKVSLRAQRFADRTDIRQKRLGAEWLLSEVDMALEIYPGRRSQS